MGFHKIPTTSVLPSARGEKENSDSQSASTESSDDDQTWDDWNSEPQVQKQCLSLFDDTTFPSALDAIAHDSKKHDFDLDAICRHLSLDFHARVRLINYIRKEKPSPTELSRLSGKEAFFSSDLYLLPAIEDDPLLQIELDVWSDEEDGDVQLGGTRGGKAPAADRRVRMLEQKLAQAKQGLADYRKLIESQFSLSRLAEELDEPSEAPKPVQTRDNDSHYFNSYGENDIHAVMISDKVRTSTYASFILSNPLLFQDAVVLDVGCGTGILSLFAARAGAKRVFAVDASDIAEKAEKIVKANRLDDVITVIRGKVEDIKLPGDITHVDIIVSEWMGYALLYESMLDSVLHARDRFLRPNGGVMVPSQCQMMFGLCHASEIVKDRIQFWSDVYGFDLSAMAEDVYEDAIADVVGPDTMVSDAVVIKDLHLQDITSRQLDFTAPFTLTSTASRRTTVHSFLLYFDTFFTTSGAPIPAGTEVQVVKDGEASLAEVWRVGGEGKSRRSYSQDLKEKGKGKEKITSFSTGPKSVPTHWKQTIFILREPLVVEEGTVISGMFHCRKSRDNTRELDVEIHYSARSPNKKAVGETVIQTFKVR